MKKDCDHELRSTWLNTTTTCPANKPAIAALESQAKGKYLFTFYERFTNTTKRN